jgi:hypothetical protein
LAADAITNQDKARRAAAAAATTLAALGLCGVTALAPVRPALAADEEAPAPHGPAPAPEPEVPPTRPYAPPPSPEGGSVPAPAPTTPPATAPTDPPPVPTGEVTGGGTPPAPAAPAADPAAPTPDPMVAGVTPADGDKTAPAGKDGKPVRRATPDGRGVFGGNSAEKFLGPLGKGLFVSGGASLTSRNYSLTGTDQARQAYDQQFNFQGFGTSRVGPFQQNMDLTIQGKVFDVFNVNARLTNNRQGNYYNQSFGFNYDKRGTKVSLGDMVSASLPGNQFVTLTRTLRGLMFGRDFGGGSSFQGVASLTNSVTRRGSFRGNGTRGPYPMNAASIIPGSVTVRLNGRELADGQDYVVEPQLGQITFQNGTIINEADTVEYTYESQNFNSTPGLLTGMRFDQAFGGGAALGVTLLRQTPTGSGRGVSQYTERAAVPSDLTNTISTVAEIQPNTPVQVKYIPTDEVLVEGKDYQLNRPLHYIRLLRGFAPDPYNVFSLEIKYQPVRQAGVGGQKTVLGLDGQARLGSAATLTMQLGQSQGQSGAGDSGTAMSLTATFKGSNKLSGDIGWTDIGQGFSTIDSVAGAFLQIQKGLRGSLNYTPSKFLTVRSSMNQSRIATEQSVASSATGTDGSDSTSAATPTRQLVWSNNTNWNTGVSLLMPNWPRIDLSHNQTNQTSQYGGSSRSSFTSDQLNMAWQKGILGLSSSLGRTVSRGRSVFASTGYASDLTGLGTGYTTSTSDSASNTARFDLSLNPTWWLAFRGALGFSRSTSGGTYGGTTNARDTSFGLRLPLIPDRLEFGVNWVDSSNGRRTAADAGTGTTGNGSQFSDYEDGQRTRTTSFNARYVPFEALDLNLDLSKSLNLVPGYDNTDTTSSSLSASYTPFPRLNLTGSFTDQRLRYLGSQSGNSNNRSYSMGAQAGPFGKLTLSASFQRLNTGSAINYTTGGTSTGGGIGGINIPGAGTGFNTGTGTTNTGTTYFGQQQDMNIFSLRADYPIGGNRSLFLQWQSLDARSPEGDTSAGGSSSYYTANNYKRGVGTLGMEIRLNDLMSFTLESNLINMTDRNQSRYSYRARALNMDLSARF